MSIGTGQKRRLVASTLLGTTIEFFDVYIYGLAAGLYFGRLFFPTSPVAGTIASFGTLASGFLVRPIGGIVGGHFGDRYGRKKVLVSSMCIMGASTFAVGILPSYETIGLWAPILLVVFRLIQGFGAGAEWGGGVLMLVENMDKTKRGFWASMNNFGIGLGISIGTLIFAGLTRLPDDVQLQVWRIPFIASAGLVLVGLWIRLGVAETPAFLKAEKQAKVKPERLPVADLFTHHRKIIVCAIFLATGASSYPIYGTFGTSYAALIHLHMPTVLMFQFLNSLLAMALTVLFGWLSDRTGRRPLMILGTFLVLPPLCLFFWAANNAAMPLMLAALLLTEIGHSLVYGPLAGYLADLFDTRTRYTGISMAYQIGAGAIAGLGPLLASSILAIAGGPPHVYAVMIVVVVTGVLTIVGAALAPDRAGQELLD